MTNAQIIFQNRVFLMEEGVLKGTDEIITIADENGEREIQMPEEIKTFDEWKKAGRMVQKGQHAVAKFQIWMPKKNKKKEDADEERQEEVVKGFYKKMAFFFTIDQTKEI